MYLMDHQLVVPLLSVLGSNSGQVWPRVSLARKYTNFNYQNNISEILLAGP